MLGFGITPVHVKKLGHSIVEIRVRALLNIITKYDLGFVCECDAIKNEIIQGLFNWFTFNTCPHPEKVLNLLQRLVKADPSGYVYAFGKSKFQNELDNLRRKLSPEFHEILDEIEQALLQLGGSTRNTVNKYKSQKFANHEIYSVESSGNENSKSSSNTFNSAFILNTTQTNETSSESKLESGRQVSESPVGGIKWLVLPWQPLVTTDIAVLTATEQELNKSNDTKTILNTCQFIMDVMMQDFPAEVFLQRPTIITIFHNILRTNSMLEANIQSVVPTVLKTLRKLTRSLRFRIYYYCEPCVANKKQKLLNDNAFVSLEAEDGPDSNGPEANYQVYQSTGTSNRSQSTSETVVDDSLLQLQQMFLPVYCIETLKYVLAQLSIPVDTNFPLRDVRYITDLAHELVQLLIISVMPNIWLCNDVTALRTKNDLKELFNLLGEVMEYFRGYSITDHLRITYLQLATTIMKLLSNIVPLELANIVIPDALKVSIRGAIMDAPMSLLHQPLHSLLLEYAREFRGDEEVASIELFDEVKTVTRSMVAAITILKKSEELTESSAESFLETLKILYQSTLSLSYHKNLTVIKTAVKFLRSSFQCFSTGKETELGTKLILSLLAHGDVDIQHATYVECYTLVKNILGVEYVGEKLSSESLTFLLRPSVLAEIICHGLTSEDSGIREMSNDIIVFILKGKIQMGEKRWLQVLETLIPVLHLLQCHADTRTPLGQCITKMFDPDVSNDIQLPFIEVLKGNLRFLYSPCGEIREEAIYRLIWLLQMEKDSLKKLPRLSSLHGLPLGSLCIFEYKTLSVKRAKGNYERSNLLIVLEMLSESHIVDPKIRKNELVQISVMLSDHSLHNLFLSKNGLPLILDIFNKALIEKECENYPDSVIPIINILKQLVFFNNSVRHELSVNIDVLLNVVRSLFLFPNNECVKIDGAQLLCMLLFSGDVRVHEEDTKNSVALHISLPHIIVTKMKLPFECTYHWKTSKHRQSDMALLHTSNPEVITFIRQYWAWNCYGVKILWKTLDDLRTYEISQKLMTTEHDLYSLRNSFPFYCCQQQLFNIQRYLNFYKALQHKDEDIGSLPWEETFERFLSLYPTIKEDCDLFVDLLIFLQLYLNVMRNRKSLWISKILKNMTGSLADLFTNSEVNSRNVYQSVLRLVRMCAAIESIQVFNDEPKNTWILFVEFAVSTSFGNQRYYNLAYLDWLLSCLMYLIGQCEWENHKNLLESLCNALLELISSFYNAGQFNFMGLSITRNSIICLNHLLHQMQICFNKHLWTAFWCEEDRTLKWLPMLLRSRDPLVRASVLQFLAGLMNIMHIVPQLLNLIAMAPSDLCHMLLQCVTDREEACLVKEHACIAFCNLLKNCSSLTVQCEHSLQSQAILTYIEQHNTYDEISALCSNIYTATTLDTEQSEYQDGDKTNMQSEYIVPVPHNIWRLYNCQDESQILSLDLEVTDMDSSMELIATPSLVTAVCSLLYNLIFTIGQHEVVQQIYEHSVDKSLFRCLMLANQTNAESRKTSSHYSNVLEMYVSICTVFTSCLIHSNEYAIVVRFPPELLDVLFRFLNVDLCQCDEPRLMYLRNRLWTEIYKFIAALSLTEDQHFEAVQTALQLCNPMLVMNSICVAIKDSTTDLRMSAIDCLSFLLAQDIQNSTLERNGVSLRAVLDSPKKINEEEDSHADDDNPPIGKIAIGGELCELLMNLFVAHNYATSKKNCKQSEDKIVIVAAFTNLLYVSKAAKQTALEEVDLSETALMILKELYVQLNLQPFEIYKKHAEKKSHPLLNDANSIFLLLLNFMYKSAIVKIDLARKGLADILHKLWAWIALNKTISTNALKLLASFTARLPAEDDIVAQSLTLTTTLPGTGLRKSPTTYSLIHVVIQISSKEIEKVNVSIQLFDNDKMLFAFQILRNVLRAYECRVCISKSNLLQFFTKIHPSVTKRLKPWPLVEMYCLEFVMDFTYYEEGQLCVPKATDAMDVLLHLARCSSRVNRVLAVSILRNLTFNKANRPRFLSSVDFINLLHDIFKTGSSCEINLASCMLLALISNNQKGKLIARSAGFSQSIRKALGRCVLDADGDKKMQIDMLNTVLEALSVAPCKIQEK
ncbi:rotatin isoform X2 [Pseudomyrmex gracilis]|uniref:rotatin isoform X2 n=1 Tax=Pseudomyrmex gracilis TaxID=219809 RepID=UPI000994EB84|nr:rotatin isoform X2 [Pseudomyrmex gracilis]